MKKRLRMKLAKKAINNIPAGYAVVIGSASEFRGTVYHGFEIGDIVKVISTSKTEYGFPTANCEREGLQQTLHQDDLVFGTGGKL